MWNLIDVVMTMPGMETGRDEICGTAGGTACLVIFLICLCIYKKLKNR